MANRNFANSRMYTGHVMPVLLDCNFVVDSTNGNGLGIRSLKGPYVQNAFMHTTVSPGLGNSNPNTPGLPVTNPNPASGTIVIQLVDNYARSLSGFNASVSPVSGTPIVITAAGAHLVVGTAYIIVSVGTSTAADYLAIGVPAGITPAVGVSFIAAATGAGTGSGAVEVTAAAGSNIMSIETVGDPNLSLSPLPSASQGFGGQLILQCRDATGAIAAPADGTVISIAMMLSNSSILIAGE